MCTMSQNRPKVTLLPIFGHPVFRNDANLFGISVSRGYYCLLKRPFSGTGCIRKRVTVRLNDAAFFNNHVVDMGIGGKNPGSVHDD